MSETLALLPARIQDKITIDRSGCWIWKAAVNASGYGHASAGGRNKSALAHRLVFEILRGPIAKDFELDHLCRQTLCVRPSHLEVVTGAENQRRKRDALTTCKHGHPYNDQNTYRRPADGGRDCRTCIRARSRAYRLRRSA